MSNLENYGRHSLASERIIVQAPLSFTGITKRCLRLTEPGRFMDFHQLTGTAGHKAASASLNCLIAIGMVLLLTGAWTVVLFWYSFFGLLVVPYRLIRRSDRDRKRQELQHREMIMAAQAAQAEASRYHQYPPPGGMADGPR